MDQYDAQPAANRSSRASGDRPWIGVHFTCSNMYIRVPKNRDKSGYTARCPRCGKCMRFRVGSAGTAERFFQLSCSA